MVATSTALMIAAGTAAAGQAASAVVASKGAKNAAKTQSAAADKALALQRQMYAEQQQRLAPLQAQGQRAGQAMEQFLSSGGTAGLPAYSGPGAQYQRRPPPMPGAGGNVGSSGPPPFLGGGAMGGLTGGAMGGGTLASYAGAQPGAGSSPYNPSGATYPPYDPSGTGLRRYAQ